MKKAMIAMSGGVDSSVAAWLMKRDGYDCMGVTMRLFAGEDSCERKGHTCCSLDDVEDARSVARQLGIPYFVFNFTEDFGTQIMDRFVCAYENGRLTQAITRGRDGIIGEDVTHTVKTFLNVPLTIPILESFEVRGEGVISWKNFDAINAELNDAYSHPRNLAAGSVRKLDASEAKKRRLEFWAFDLVSDSLESGSKRAQQQLLARCGFSVVPYLYLPSSSSAHDLELAISGMQPAKFEYPVDGLIMECDDLAYGKSLGATGHHENRLIALKWADELYETTFRSVELATTRTGMVSLTARFDPVSMDGATVSRAYLHNLDNFHLLQLGSGDTVLVYRANMIIPQIADNLTKSGTYQLSMSCPCCGAALEVGETTGGTHQLFCWNRSCTAKLVQKFVHFCDKSRMNIEGLSETTLEKLIGHGWIHTFADLYELEQHRDAILQTDGFGEKSFKRLQAAIEKSRTCTLQIFHNQPPEYHFFCQRRQDKRTEHPQE